VSANAAFGRKSKGIENNDPVANDYENENSLVDLGNEDLMEAVETFALMSEEEMEEAFSEVIDMLGGDDADPEIIESVKEIMNMAKSMDESSGMGDFMAMEIDEDEIAKATDIALEMISKSDWELIYNKQSDILNSLISAGKFSVEDAAVYKSDDVAWEKELRSIWDGLQNQARESGNYVKATDEL